MPPLIQSALAGGPVTPPPPSNATTSTCSWLCYTLRAPYTLRVSDSHFPSSQCPTTPLWCSTSPTSISHRSCTECDHHKWRVTCPVGQALTPESHSVSSTATEALLRTPVCGHALRSVTSCNPACATCRQPPARAFRIQRTGPRVLPPPHCPLAYGTLSHRQRRPR